MTSTAERTTERPPVDPRIWTRRVAVTRARGRRRLRIVLAGLAVCALGGAAFGMVHSSVFGAKHLSVTGAVHTPAGEILSAAGLLTHPPLVDIDPAVSANHIEALPWIQSARVSLHWPDSVSVAVTERRPVAAVLVGGNGLGVSGKTAHMWVLVDASGRVLADTGARPAGLLTLDVPAAPGSPGTALAAADEPGVAVAASLPATLARRVAVIDVDAQSGVTLGISGGLEAVIGAPDELRAKYIALASVLAGAPLQGGEEIDVSVPQEPAVGPASVRG
jgi:cell division protein FtsQ